MAKTRESRLTTDQTVGSICGIRHRGHLPDTQSLDIMRRVR